MILLWKIFFLTLVTTSILFLAWILFYPKPAPQSPGEAVNRMIALQDDGRYDEAVKTVQTWMHKNPRDASRDGLLYQQIAMVYITKAYKKPDSREDSVGQAQQNLEMALSLHDQGVPGSLGTDLFEIGTGYEALGNLPVDENCKFYEKARQLFERQLPLIQSDTYTAYGTTVRLEPLRAEVRKHLAAVRQKLSNAGCPAN
jgi:tetratricopeptide (TPR) repeat protein